MSKVPAHYGTRCAVRLVFAGMTAALLAGCAESNRLFGDSLGNPFKSASTDPTPTASYDREMAPPPPYSARRSAPISSQPLAAPPPRRVATYEAPVHTSPRLAPSSAPSQTDRTASIATSTHGLWSTTGGMSVIAANGETAGVLAQRYNVPTEALLKVNGLSSAAQIRPGTRIVIPVYSATGGSTRVAVSEPESRTREPALRGRLIAKREMAPAHEKMHPAKGPQATQVVEKVKTVYVYEKAAKPEHKKAEKVVEVVEARPARKVAKVDAEAATKTKVVKVVVTKDKAGKTTKIAKIEVIKEKPAKIEVIKEKTVKVARIETIKERPLKTARVEVMKERTVKVAKVEEVPEKAPVDPTPTASLPPANDKSSASGNPEFRWPAHGRIIQGFKTGGNDGINIAVPEGTSVKAAENGVVAYAGSEIKGFGNLVLIRHPNGYVTAYANNGNIEVHRGEQVKRGQTIAKSGQSGNVASPQLHFELRKGSTPVDPTHFLAGL